MNVTTIPRLSRRASTHLDMVRGLSALLVVSHHLRNLFFINFPDLDHKSALTAVVYALTSLGHQCVMVFFVLSGYFVSASVLKYHAPEYWSGRAYAINRLSRLYVVLIPALLLTALCDFIARQLPFGAHYFQQVVANFGPEPFVAGEHLTHFAASLFFLQTVLTNTFGSNGVLWTLANEFWYYAIWPLVFIATASKSRKARWSGAAAALFLLIVLPRTMSERFLIWLLGAAVVLAARYRERISALFRSRLVTWAAAVALAATMVLARRYWSDLPFVFDILVGIAFSVLLAGIVYNPRQEQPSTFYAAAANGVASFSFSLYATHFPLLLLARTALGGSGLWLPDPRHVGLAIALFAGVVAFAWGFSKLTEARTDSLRHVINAGLAWILDRWTDRRSRVDEDFRDEPLTVVYAEDRRVKSRSDAAHG